MGRNSALGVDIGTHAVHVAHVSRSRGELTVVNFGGLQLPRDAVSEGEVIDPQVVGDVIARIVSHAKIREKDAYVGVANQRVVVRQVELPWMEERELRESLQFQVQEHIPIPVENAELDFYVLDDFRGDNDQRMLRLLLVAAQKTMVANHVDAIREGGLRPAGVDLNPFAMIRAIGTSSAIEEGSEVLIDIGAGVTDIVIHREGVPEFVRILVLGGNDITRGIEAGRSVSREDAEQLKREASARGGHDDVAQIVGDRTGEFIEEIRNSLDYYSAQMGSTRLARIRLSGGGALLEGLADRLSEAVRLPVEVANPFDRWPTKGTAYGPDELAAVGPALVTAIGLAAGGLESG